jgi:hypothetical protein
MKNFKTNDPSSVINSSYESENYKFIETKKFADENKQEIKRKNYLSHLHDKNYQELQEEIRIRNLRNKSKSEIKSTTINEVNLNPFYNPKKKANEFNQKNNKINYKLNSNSSLNYYLIQKNRLNGLNGLNKFNIIKISSDKGKKYNK